MSLQLPRPNILPAKLEAFTDFSKKPGEAVGTSSIDMEFEDQDQIREIQLLYRYLDKIKEMVRPGCPHGMLKVALDYVSSLSKTLTFISSSPHHKLLASL